MILQPLVENAIYHGIKEMNRQGRIRVSVSENDTQLIVSIYDNGRGFVASETTNATLVRLGGVGLKNVDQRLQLQFGKSYHMDIQSEENTYTEIRLYFRRFAGGANLASLPYGCGGNHAPTATNEEHPLDLPTAGEGVYQIIPRLSGSRPR